MKKAITILALALSIGAGAQDSSKVPSDTMYVLSKPDMQMIVNLFRQNGLVYNGKALGFDEVLQMIQYFEKKMITIPKKENKK